MKIIKIIVITILALALFTWLYDITTPKQCKVPIEKMSQFCLDLRYP